MISASKAIELLREGNTRYTSDCRNSINIYGHQDLSAGQNPFAVILGCSDSRVPVEQIFSQNAGNLFVVRIAGNITTPSATGSIEFAVKFLKVKLIVILGHTGCGAVSATLDELQHAPLNVSPELQGILTQIRPAVEPLLKNSNKIDRNELLQNAVRANVRNTVNNLCNKSSIRHHQSQRERLRVVGAVYHLDSGVVEWMNDTQSEFAE